MLWEELDPGSVLMNPACVQRCESMAALLKQHEAHTVLDVGCGAGRLVEHLLKQVTVVLYLPQRSPWGPFSRKSGNMLQMCIPSLVVCWMAYRYHYAGQGG